MKSQQPRPYSSVDLPALVAIVKGGDQKGRGELQRLLSRGIRFYLSRRLGLQQLEARVQETVTILISALETEDVHEHMPFISLVRTLVLKQVVFYGNEYVQKSNQPGVVSPGVNINLAYHPDRKAIHLEDIDRMVAMLSAMSLWDQEALTRFYFHQQSQEIICEEMRLSRMQFLRLKARAKGALGKTATDDILKARDMTSRTA